MLIKQKYWHTLFEASVLIKAINGIWETITGMILIIVSRTAVAHAFYGITKHEISSGTEAFAAYYILAHGVINIFLAYYLHKQKLWAFWISVAFFSVSALFLTYKVNAHNSLFLYGLILFDIICIFLTIHEYQYRRGMLELSPVKI